VASASGARARFPGAEQLFLAEQKIFFEKFYTAMKSVLYFIFC
jgi:hypothetical protein